MRFALVVGHHSASPGAHNAADGTSEFEFNTRLAINIWRRLRATQLHLDPVIVFRRTLALLPADIRDTVPVFAISLHANAYNGAVSGTETLLYHRAGTATVELAEILQNHLVEGLGLRDRGCKRVRRDERGGWLLSRMRVPTVLCEPFFIDNDRDLARAREVDLVGIYIEAIKQAARKV